MYKTLPLDWVNWNPAQMSYDDYAKIVKPDHPLTPEEKNKEAASALIEYQIWKDGIPEKSIELSKSTYPTRFANVAQLEAKAATITNNELRRMVLQDAGDILAKIIGTEGPLL